MPHYTLTVVTSQDGFIARSPTDAPQNWASEEEQVLFFRDVEAADWAIMGRNTHEAADRPERRRIIFSTRAAGCDWRRPTQLWVDPAGLGGADLPGLVAGVQTLRRGLILGGTGVHDWCLAEGIIDRVHLTVEPVTFGTGLPLFTGAGGDPEATLSARGFARASREVLNSQGTVYSVWHPTAV